MSTSHPFLRASLFLASLALSACSAHDSRSRALAEPEALGGAALPASSKSAFSAPASPAPAAPAARNRMPQGGGLIYPAWTGHYWANPTMEGPPAYTRSDIRVRFDWGDWRPILGVHAESVRDFPRENISARWSGKLVARFDETYSFKLLSDEQARFRIRPAGATAWTTLIDASQPHARRTDQADMALRPGTVYEVELDYVNLTGDAVCVLSWSSPSTPEEVVDYAAANSVHFMAPQAYANLFSFNGDIPDSATRGGIAVDENGWPTQDFSTSLIVGYTHYVGRLLVAFKGRAEVRMPGTFVVGGKTYEGVLPKGVGYDPATNQTRAHLDPKPGPDGETTRTTIQLVNSQRSPDSPVGSGVTDLHVMIARQIHGKIPHEIGEIISQEARDAFLPVFTFRVQRTGLNEIVKWDERTSPNYSKIIGQKWRADMAYEKLILAANETGRDLHLNFGGSIDEEFMRKLALLFKYGSDGKDPYTRPTANPVWPPLNPNLRLYLEHGNEMGWSGIQPRDWWKDYEAIRAGKTEPVWGVLNFDGALDSDPAGGIMRYHAYRTARMSENMRSVWGDAAMGDQIRVLLFGQYERWFQNGMVQFLDDYYNNPKHVASPRPASEILWGAGPAIYYGTSNNFMSGDSFPLTNGNFEDAKVAPGESVLAPEAAGWKFTGGAGIVDLQDSRHDAIASATPGAAYKVATRAAVGYQFTVGDRDLFAYQVGRIVQPGDKGKLNTQILSADGTAPFSSKHAAFTFNKTKPGDTVYSPLEYCGWATTDSSRVGVWRLEAGKTYFVVTDAAKGEIAGPDSVIEPGPGLTIDGAVIVENGTVGYRDAGGTPKKISGAGRGFPFATFRYGFARQPAPGLAVAPSDPLVDPTWPKGGKGKSFVPKYHRSGVKTAFIAGQGSLSQTFEIQETGEYALVFTANAAMDENSSKSRFGSNPFKIRIGDRQIWNNTLGDGRKPKGGLFQWGTSYLTLEKGTHTLVIETTNKDPRSVVYFYALHLGNLSDFSGGPTAQNFLSAGAATGQTDGRFAMVAELTAAMAQLWGLVPYAYEGGTNAGGDWGGAKVDYAEQFKWNHPVSKVADNQWARYWHNFGGSNAFYYYPGFDYSYIHRAETFMPWAAAIERAHGWELEPKGPPAAPLTFTPAKKHFQSARGSTWVGWDHPFESDNAYEAAKPTLEKEGTWKGFIFRAPKAGSYTVSARTTAGGTLQVLVNEAQATAAGPSGTPVETTVWLTQGVHSVKVKNLTGSFDLEAVTIE
jgi:hypothetical protein